MNRKLILERPTKIMALLLVLVLVAVTGTQAWSSASQYALNEAYGLCNPGGRLHDDFNGQNKDIYVENFNTAGNGVSIYARIKLSEYMEIGEDAGVNKESSTRDAVSVTDGAVITDKSTWPVHYSSADSSKTSKISNYWSWGEGGSTVYMPTFNRNKDSMLADNNGTLVGNDGLYPADSSDAGDKFSDYVRYQVGAKKSGYEIHDADKNDKDELTAAQTKSIINAASSDEVKKIASSYEDNISVTSYNSSTGTYEQVEHIAKKTQTAKVMSMADWIAAGAKAGPYWVYDTDGWVYWAQPIEAGTATGLLLDSITQEQKMTKSWYYAIDVKAEFVTADDSGWEDNTGFWENASQAPSDNAKALLKAAGVKVDADDPVMPDLDNDDDDSLTSQAKNVQTEIKSILKSQEDGELGADTKTVSIDGVSFYVLGEENGEALLLQKNLVKYQSEDTGDKETLYMPFGDSSNSYEDSKIREYLNSSSDSFKVFDGLSVPGYLNGKDTLKELVVKNAIKTRSRYDETTFDSTTDEVFLLSEADVFGTFNYENARNEDYTLKSKDTLSEGVLGVVDSYWLRSPCAFDDNLAVVYGLLTQDGQILDGMEYDYSYDMFAGVRPAVWVSLGE